jgi:hypothetical protein
MICIDSAVTRLSFICHAHPKSCRALIHSPTARLE